MLEQLKKYLALLIFVAFLALAAWGYFKYNAYQNELADLRNQVASKDKTIEDIKNSYTKLASENTDLKTSNEVLNDLYKKTGQDLIAQTQATVYWKGKYEYNLTHNPVGNANGSGVGVVHGPVAVEPVQQKDCTKEPLPYVSMQDIGLLKLTLKTTTRDPEYKETLVVEPGSKPLQLTLDLTRDKKKQWRSRITSSDERIGVDIGVNSVNIEPLEEKWYERIKLVGDLGVGPTGILGGFGVVYELEWFDVGPKVWATPSGQFAGATITYAPFKKVK
jgi:hypothetical protein